MSTATTRDRSTMHARPAKKPHDFCTTLENLSPLALDQVSDALIRHLTTATGWEVHGPNRPDNMPGTFHIILPPQVGRHVWKGERLGQDMRHRFNRALKACKMLKGYQCQAMAMFQMPDGSKVFRFNLQQVRPNPYASTPRMQASCPKARTAVSKHLATLGLADTGHPLTRTYLENIVKPAWKKLARHYHPDLRPNDAHAEQRAKEINAAYAALKRLHPAL